MKKKVLFGLIFALCVMALSVFAVSAQETEGDWIYEEFVYNEVSGVEVVGYDGTQTDVYIPAALGGKPVLKVGDSAFKGKTGLNSVAFSSDIKVLGSNAFEGATGLVCVLLSEGLVEIGDNVFDGCTAFNSIILYGGITKIGDTIFTGCEKATVYYVGGTFGETYALAAKANADIKDAVAIIGGEEKYDEVDVNYIHFYLLNGEAVAVYQLKNEDKTERTSINIPAVVNGYPVTRIRENCFKKSAETRIGYLHIPSSVRKIGENAFENCNFWDIGDVVTLPEGIQVIEKYAFAKTQGRTFVIPDSVVTLAEGAFANSYYAHFEISKNSKLEYIGDYAFTSMSGKQSLPNSKGIYIPESVEYLGNYAFANTWLKTLTIANRDTQLGKGLFSGNSLFANLYAPNSLSKNTVEVWEGAYKGGPGYVYVDDISAWINSPFYPKAKSTSSNNSGIYLYCLDDNGNYTNNFVIPEGVTDINGAFNYVKNLNGITLKLPSTVKTLGADDLGCWYSTPNLEFSTKNLTKIESGAISQYISVYYLDSLDGYLANLGNYAQRPLQHASAVYELNDSGEYEKVTTLTIPKTMTSIKASDFSGISSTFLASWFDTLVIGENISSVASYAFRYCPSIKTVHLNINPTSLTLASDAFDSSNSITTCYVDDYKKWGQNVVIKNAAANPLTNATSVYFNGELTNTARIPARESVPSFLFAGKWVRSVVFDESDVYRTLESSCFAGCTTLESITLPDSLTTINASAFNGCTSLNSVVLSSSLNTIANYAFYGCTSLPEIIIPDSVSTLGAYAFYNCSALQSAKLPKNLTKIEDHTFYGCSSLKSIVIPKNVQTISFYVFNNCSSLEQVIFEEGSVLNLINYYSFNGCRALSSINIPDSVTKIGTHAFMGCTSLTSFICPPNITAIDEYCFSGSGIKEITLTPNITSIGRDAFSYTPLESIDLAYVTTLGISTFSHCANLTTIDVSSLKVIPAVCFGNCTNLKEVIFGNSLTKIDRMAFSYCTSLTEIVLPNSLTTLSETGTSDYDGRQFIGCTSLKSVTLSEKLTIIPRYCFQSCTSLESLTIPKSVTTANYCFVDKCTSLKEIYFLNPDKDSIVSVLYYSVGPTSFTAYVHKDSPAHQRVSSLKNCTIVFLAATNLFTFSEDSVSQTAKLVSCTKSAVGEVTVPALSPNGCTVTEIADNAFSSCTSITKITLPETIERIGSNAFEKCAKLTDINLPSAVTYIGSKAFRETPIAALAIPEGVRYIGESAFEGAFGITSITLSNIDTIAKSAFKNCSSLESVSIAGGATTIGADAFYGCRALTSVALSPQTASIGSRAFMASGIESVSIPGSVTEISSETFRNCLSLVSVTLGNGVETVGERAFSGCGKLSSVKLASTLDSIGSYAFNSCAALVEITVPSSVTQIGNSAFEACTALSAIKLSEGLTVIENSLFKGCRALSFVIIPSSVNEIKEFAFAESGITSVEIPNSVKVLGESVFKSCTNLKSAVLPKGITTLPAYTFSGCTRLSRVSGITGYTEFGAESFKSCANIQPLEVLHTNLEIIGDSAFAYAFTESATGIALPESLKSVGSNAFVYCDSIVKTRIPSSLTAESTAIANGAFDHNPLMVLWVYRDSYGLDYAIENDYLYFIVKNTANPDIDFGCAVSGTVRYIGGKPAAGVDVQLIYDDGSVAQTTKTDASGQYIFKYAEVGAYTLRAIDTKDAGNIDTENIAINRKNVFSVILTGETDLLLRRGFTVSGTTTATGGVSDDNPIIVTMTDLEGNAIASSTVTAAGGSFSFANINNGEYIIVAENNNGMSFKSVTVYNADYQDLRLVIDDLIPENPGDDDIINGFGSIVGKIYVQERDNSRLSKDWVKLTLYDSDGNVLKRTRSQTNSIDAKYDYLFKNLPKGEYTIVAEVTVLRPHHHSLHANDPRFKDRNCEYSQPFDLKGYAYVEITESGQYVADDIFLAEENNSVATIQGKVTAKGSSQPSTVTLRDVFHHEIATVRTPKNGKFEFKNIKDGLYTLTAVTDYDGVGFAVVCLRNGELFTKFFDEDSKVNGGNSIHIKVAKPERVAEHEAWFEKGGALYGCNSDNAASYKQNIEDMKRFYDSLSDRDRQAFSPQHLSKLWEMIEWLNSIEKKFNVDNSGYDEEEKGKVSVDNVGSIIPSDDEDTSYTVTLTIDRLTEDELSSYDLSATEDGNDAIEIVSDSQYVQTTLEETAKNNGKQLGKKKKKNNEETEEVEYFYYNIEFTFQKGEGETVSVSDIAKETDTNGKLRMTLPIPAEYLDDDCKSYSLLHVHNGEVVTLTDLDDNPATITVEVDKFSIFALARSYEEQVAYYTVTWVNDDDTVLEKDTGLLYGTMPEYNGEQPTKSGNAELSYTFAGWTPEVCEVSENAIYKAVYESRTNTYKVTWLNYDGSLLFEEGGIPFGATPEYKGEAPKKASDAQYTYTFIGWEPEISPVTGDIVYTAVYSSTVNNYTVTWLNHDGTVLYENPSVPYGSTPEYKGQTPVRVADAQYTYTFIGWNPEISAVTGKVVYTAKFKEEINKYTVTWENYDGTLLETDENVPFGTTPEYNGKTPERAATAQYTYTFSGWLPTVSEVTGNVTYTATFKEVVNTYTVKWFNDDGTLLETDNDVSYGTLPSYNGETPVKEATDLFRYVFAGWSPEVSVIEGNTEYTATFNKYPISGETYSVSFKYGDTTVTKVVIRGEALRLPELTDEIKASFVPERAGEPITAYTFFWRYIDDSVVLLNSNDGSEVYYLPGTEYIPDGHSHFEAVFVYSGAQLILERNPDKADASMHELVFDIYLSSSVAEAVNKIESGEFTTVLAAADKKCTYELIPNLGMTFNVEDNDRVLFKRADGNAAYLVPEAYTGGYRVLLGSVKVIGAGNGSISLVDAVAHRHVISGDDDDNLAVEVYVRDTTADYTVEVPTAKLTLTVDFRNTVEDNSYDYQRMTITVSGSDLSKPITVKLGSNSPEVFVDEANKTNEAVTAGKMSNNSYTVTLDGILSLNRAYTVEVRGDGYRTARYTVSMTGDKELYFWNNVMDNPTFIEKDVDASRRNTTFLAGDIVKDNSINIYDLSAVVSYFGTEGISVSYHPEYIKYDLNRDGRIDSVDVAYVLVSWGK